MPEKPKHQVSCLINLSELEAINGERLLSAASYVLF